MSTQYEVVTSTLYIHDLYLSNAGVDVMTELQECCSTQSQTDLLLNTLLQR